MYTTELFLWHKFGIKACSKADTAIIVSYSKASLAFFPLVQQDKNSHFMPMHNYVYNIIPLFTEFL